MLYTPQVECYQKNYKELLSIWQNQPFEPLIADEIELMVRNPAFSNFLQHFPCVFWIFDLKSLKFVLVSRNTLELFGYDSKLFKENGLDFCNQIKHSDDLYRTWMHLRKVWD